MIETFDMLISIHGERKTREIIATLCFKSTLAEFDRHVDILWARSLLAEKTPRAMIKQKLIDTGLSERTAYRLIGQALQR